MEEVYGKEYVTTAQASSGKGKKIQDAHEAIRPTDITRLDVYKRQACRS